MAYGNERVNVKFKHKKKINVKLKMYIHWSNAFAFKRSFFKISNFTPITFLITQKKRNQRDVWFKRRGYNGFFLS